MYWAFLDGDLINPVIKFEDQFSIKTEKESYSPGELVRVYMSFCKYRNITPMFQTALINGSLHLYTSEYRSSGIVGCREDVLTDYEFLPPDIRPGVYHFNRVLKYKVNPIREIIVEQRTVNFTIKK